MGELELMNKKAFARSGYRSVIISKAIELGYFNNPTLTPLQSVLKAPFKEVLRQLSINNASMSI
jgi:hypothetical protein